MKERVAIHCEIERGGYDAAMSFDEIGRRLGITRGGAWMLYASAIRRLRRRPHCVLKLAELLAARDAMRREMLTRTTLNRRNVEP